MTLQEIQYKAQAIMQKWRDDDSAPYVEFVEELASMDVPELPEDLEEAAFTYENDLWESGFKDCGYSPQEVNDAFKAGAEWQKAKMMEKAVEFEVTNVGILQMGDLLTDRGIQAGDKMIIIILKEDENVD